MQCMNQFSSESIQNLQSVLILVRARTSSSANNGVRHSNSSSADYSSSVIQFRENSSFLLFALKIHKFYLIPELSSPSNDLVSLRRTTIELRLLAKHNPENRIRIARASAVRPLISLLSNQDPILQDTRFIRTGLFNKQALLGQIQFF